MVLAAQHAPALPVHEVVLQQFTPASGGNPPILELDVVSLVDQPGATVSYDIYGSLNLGPEAFGPPTAGLQLDLVFRLHTFLDLNPPPTLDIEKVGFTLRDGSANTDNPDSGLGNTSDDLYFLAGAASESSLHFADPPAGGDVASESLLWSDGVLPADDPLILGVSLSPDPAEFHMRLSLDPDGNFPAGNFELNLRVHLLAAESSNVVPEGSTWAAAAMLGATAWIGSRRRRDSART